MNEFLNSKKSKDGLKSSKNKQINDFKKGNYNKSNDSKSNKIINTIFEDILDNNIYTNTLYKINLQNNHSKNKLFSIINRKKKKKIFKNKILKINIDTFPNKYENHKFNDFSLVCKNTLYNKFKMLPNLKKYQNLTNERLLQLTVNNDKNDFIMHKQKNDKKGSNIFNEYINNTIKTNSMHSKNNKSEKNHSIKFYKFKKNKASNKEFNNISQKILKSNYFDINYKISLHKSWCNLFKKIKPKTSKNIKNKNIVSIQNTLTTEESAIEHKNITLEKKGNKSISESNSANKFQRKRGLRKYSAIDRFLFKLVNKDECYEDYVSDGKPIDKYLLFKQQIEKKKKYIEKHLLELRRMANINII